MNVQNIYYINLYYSIIRYVNLTSHSQTNYPSCAESQCIVKDDMCASLRSLAKGLDSCTINADCTCVSCSTDISEVGTVPINICIVDPCTTPVCFSITAGALFSRTVCSTTTIDFSFKKTVKFFFLRRTITVHASATVALISMPSKIQMSVSSWIYFVMYTYY